MRSQHLQVAVFDPVVSVVIYAYDVEAPPVRLLERQRRVGEGPFEHGAQFGGERGEVAGQVAAVKQRRIGFDACEAVGETLAGHDPAQEQGRFATGDEGDLPPVCLRSASAWPAIATVLRVVSARS